MVLKIILLLLLKFDVISTGNYINLNTSTGTCEHALRKSCYHLKELRVGGRFLVRKQPVDCRYAGSTGAPQFCHNHKDLAEGFWGRSESPINGDNSCLLQDFYAKV